MSKRKAAKGVPGREVPARASRKAGKSSSGFDFEAIRELARIAGEFDLAEVEVEPSGRIRVSRRNAGSVALTPSFGERSHHGPAVSLVGPSSAAPASAPAPAAADNGIAVTSPFVGTFYRSPSPDAQSFVEVGQIVRKGQVICIVEAMKLMNEIESEADGKVVDILVKNGEHVEYGQPLFRLEKI